MNTTVEAAFAQGYHYGEVQPEVTSKHLLVEAATRFGDFRLRSAFISGYRRATTEEGSDR